MQPFTATFQLTRYPYSTGLGNGSHAADYHLPYVCRWIYPSGVHPRKIYQIFNVLTNPTQFRKPYGKSTSQSHLKVRSKLPRFLSYHRDRHSRSYLTVSHQLLAEEGAQNCTASNLLLHYSGFLGIVNMMFVISLG